MTNEAVQQIDLVMGNLSQLRDSFLKMGESAPSRKPRTVSKMAKNVQMGDLVELPSFGTVTVGAWCMNGEMVCLGDGGHRNETVPATQRLRVIRAA